MSFDTIEISEYFHAIEIYHFQRAQMNWYYTSSDEDVTFGGKIYLSVPINRSRIEATQDLGKTPVKINVTKDNEFAVQFIAESPTDVINLTITRLHAASATESAVTFKGRVIDVSFSETEATITCQSNLSVLRRPGLRRLYQTTCGHVLYGGPCGVVKNSFKIDATISTINSNILTAGAFAVSIDPAFDDTWLLGGLLEFTGVEGITRRFITRHDNSGAEIELNLPVQGLLIGSVVRVFPGCDHSPETCRLKFDNIEDYGGFPFIPEKNPMDGTSVF